MQLCMFSIVAFPNENWKSEHTRLWFGSGLSTKHPWRISLTTLFRVGGNTYVGCPPTSAPIVCLLPCCNEGKKHIYPWERKHVSWHSCYTTKICTFWFIILCKFHSQKPSSGKHLNCSVKSFTPINNDIKNVAAFKKICLMERVFGLIWRDIQEIYILKR